MYLSEFDDVGAYKSYVRRRRRDAFQACLLRSEVEIEVEVEIAAYFRCQQTSLKNQHLRCRHCCYCLSTSSNKQLKETNSMTTRGWRSYRSI